MNNNILRSTQSDDFTVERSEAEAPKPKASGMILQKQPTGEVKVPADMFANCPLRAMALRAVTQCEKCDFFHGLRDCGPNEKDMPFENRYHVICSAPITRRITRVEIAGD